MVKRYILILMGLSILSGCLNHASNECKVKTEVLQYLKNKYKKEFVILMIKKTKETDLYYTINAAPKGNSKEKFSVYTYEKNREYI